MSTRNTLKHDRDTTAGVGFHLTRGQSAERHQLAVLRVPQRQPRAFQAPKQGQPWRGLKHRIVDMAFAQPVVGDFA